GEYDALVLAAAGLDRLDRRVGAPLRPEEMTPAPGQGCLIVEGRSGEEWSARLGELLTHRPSLVRLTAERALVSGLEASCRTPIGAHAAIDGDRLALSAFAGLPDGSGWVRDVLAGDPAEPAELGRAVARRLLAAGADHVLAAAERWAGDDAL
ncbi:MAG: hydroxymethylbilane synthase, partial [Actinobacteria bacterium]|nr:hydroxymethylbilane synthase [Actinomycetota bacterium]